MRRFLLYFILILCLINISYSYYFNLSLVCKQIKFKFKVAMLDRQKLTKQLEAAVRNSCDSIFQEGAVAKKMWNKIASDSLFLERASLAQPS